ncbi:FAD-binding oxidoreductase [Sorangium sp. So ce1389]|uniref:FAD-binding oxidoreductase n=1 Tax=Sorangium sp. So ce1389 TaxID=3133336 RepID=UPI003F5DA492
MSAAPQLTGRVVLPGDPGYGDAREAYNARVSRSPRVVVFCQDAGDVANAVRWATARGVELRARSGRHCYEGFSVIDAGLVIDVSDLHSVRIDRERGVAVVGAGADLLTVYDALGQVGVTLPAGSCPTVGIAGLTLGGGFGLLSRALGLTCDSLLAVEMVTADGEVIRADDKENQDLLWACQGGGGGNFGVVTSFTFKTHHVPEVSIFSISWPWAELPGVLQAWQAFAPFADERLTSLLTLKAESAGGISCVGQLLGTGEELRRLIQPLLSVQAAVPFSVSPSSVSIETLPHLRAVGQFGGLGSDPEQWTVHQHQAQERFKNSSAYAYERFDAGAIATLAAELSRAPSSRCLVQLDAYGGAVGRVAPDATAFPHRRALWSLQYQAYWNAPAQEAESVAWVERVRRSMLPYTRGAYINYIDANIEDWLTAYYGPNVARLAAVKAKYDPRELFRFPRSIPRAPPGAAEAPAGGARGEGATDERAAP